MNPAPYSGHSILRGPQARGGVQVGPPIAAPLNQFGRTNQYQQQINAQRDNEDRDYEVQSRGLDLTNQQRPTVPSSYNPGPSPVPNFQNLIPQAGLPPQVAPPAPINGPMPPGLSGPSGAFSHAKDVSGRTGAAAIRALKDQMTRRGMSDSGMEAEGEANILGNVARQQADAEYGAVEKDYDQRFEANQFNHRDLIDQLQNNYQGQMSQRGQDIQALLALLRY